MALSGQDVDAPGEAFRSRIDVLQGPRAEDVGPVVARCPQAEHQVGADVGAAQGLQAEVVGDAFLQLAQVRLGQALVKLRLAEKDDLQELVAGGFQVGEEADFLQGFPRHGMGLVDQHHHPASGGIALQQAFLQGLEQQGGASFGQLQLQLGGQGMENLVPGIGGVGQVDRLHRGRQLFQAASGTAWSCRCPPRPSP